jgi:hypothetical protein
VNVIEAERALLGLAVALADATRGGEPPGGWVRSSPPQAAMANTATASAA